MDTERIIELAKAAELDQLKEAYKNDQSIISVSDESGVSALLWAKYFGHPKVVKWFCENRQDLSLFEAAAVGNDQALRQKLTEKPSMINTVSPDGFTALGLACFFGNLLCCDVLFDFGADTNLVSANHLALTPLHSALVNGSLQLAVKLVDFGADVNIVGAGGWTVLHYCTDLGDVDLTNFMLQKGAIPGFKNDLGLDAIEHGHEVGHIEAAEAIEEFVKKLT